MACYKLLVPVVTGGLEALKELDATAQEQSIPSSSSSSYLSFEIVVDKILTLFSLLLTTEGLRGPHYLANTKEIHQIVRSYSINLPRSKDANFGKVLLTGVKQSISMAKILPVVKLDKESTQQLESVLLIFKECFNSTSQLICGTESLESIIAPVFKDAIHSITILEQKEEDDSVTPFDINIKLATTLCESLYQVNFVADIAAELFPFLCKLMNSGESNLRRGASNLLTRIDFGRVLEREKKVAIEANNVAKEKVSHELTQISNQVMFERDRAIAAEAQVRKLQEQYEALFANFENLKLQKDNLEQQVAVLSEGSAYT